MTRCKTCKKEEIMFCYIHELPVCKTISCLQQKHELCIVNAKENFDVDYESDLVCSFCEKFVSAKNQPFFRVGCCLAFIHNECFDALELESPLLNCRSCNKPIPNKPSKSNELNKTNSLSNVSHLQRSGGTLNMVYTAENKKYVKNKSIKNKFVKIGAFAKKINPRKFSTLKENIENKENSDKNGKKSEIILNKNGEIDEILFEKEKNDVILIEKEKIEEEKKEKITTLPVRISKIFELVKTHKESFDDLAILLEFQKITNVNNIEPEAKLFLQNWISYIERKNEKLEKTAKDIDQLKILNKKLKNEIVIFQNKNEIIQNKLTELTSNKNSAEKSLENFKKLENELKKSKKSLRSLAESLSSKSDELDAALDSNAVLSADFETQSAKLNELRKSLSDSLSKTKFLQGQIDLKNSEMATKEKNFENLIGKIKILEENLSNSTKYSEKFQKENENLLKKLEKIEKIEKTKEKIEEENKQLKLTAEKAQSKIEKLTFEMAQLNGKNLEIEKKAKEKTDRLNELEKSEKSLSKMLSKNETKLNFLEGQIEIEREKSREIKAKNGVLLDENSNLRQKIEEKSEAFLSNLNLIKEQKAKMQNVEVEKNHLMKAISDSNRIVESKENEIASLSIQLEKCQKEKEISDENFGQIREKLRKMKGDLKNSKSEIELEKKAKNDAEIKALNQIKAIENKAYEKLKKYIEDICGYFEALVEESESDFFGVEKIKEIDNISNRFDIVDKKIKKIIKTKKSQSADLKEKIDILNASLAKQTKIASEFESKNISLQSIIRSEKQKSDLLKKHAEDRDGVFEEFRSLLKSHFVDFDDKIQSAVKSSVESSVETSVKFNKNAAEFNKKGEILVKNNENNEKIDQKIDKINEKIDKINKNNEIEKNAENNKINGKTENQIKNESKSQKMDEKLIKKEQNDDKKKEKGENLLILEKKIDQNGKENQNLPIVYSEENKGEIDEKIQEIINFVAEFLNSKNGQNLENKENFKKSENLKSNEEIKLNTKNKNLKLSSDLDVKNKNKMKKKNWFSLFKRNKNKNVKVVDLSEHCGGNFEFDAKLNKWVDKDSPEDSNAQSVSLPPPKINTRKKTIPSVGSGEKKLLNRYATIGFGLGFGDEKAEQTALKNTNQNLTNNKKDEKQQNLTKINENTQKLTKSENIDKNNQKLTISQINQISASTLPNDFLTKLSQKLNSLILVKNSKIYQNLENSSNFTQKSTINSQNSALISPFNTNENLVLRRTTSTLERQSFESVSFNVSGALAQNLEWAKSSAEFGNDLRDIKQIVSSMARGKNGENYSFFTKNAKNVSPNFSNKNAIKMGKNENYLKNEKEKEENEKKCEIFRCFKNFLLGFLSVLILAVAIETYWEEIFGNALNYLEWSREEIRLIKSASYEILKRKFGLSATYAT